MVCIYCSGKTRVTNSRPSKRSPGTWRRRQCASCNAVFTSRETADLAETHAVKRADGTIQPFSRDNLYISLYQSCGHRQTAISDANALTETIIRIILRDSSSKQGLVTTNTIIVHAKTVLGNFDTVSGTYYAAYYG